MGAGPGAPLTLSPGALAAVVVTCVLLGLVLAVGVALLVQRRCAQSTNIAQNHFRISAQRCAALHVAIIHLGSAVSRLQQQNALPIALSWLILGTRR